MQRPYARVLPPLALAVTVLAVLALPAAAQLAPSGEGGGLPPSRRSQLEGSLAAAPWQVGPLRLAPWIGLREAGWVTTPAADGSTPDLTDGELTASGGLGLRAYLPFGPDSMLAAQALPEYSWWEESDERNTWIGRYGAGWFFFFNRLEGEVTARRDESLQFLAADLLDRLPFSTDTLAARAQLRLGGHLAVFASVERAEVGVEDAGRPGLTGAARALERQTERGRAGLRYLLPGERGHLGAGAQVEETTFDAATPGLGDRSNDGTSAYAEALLRGNRLSLGVDVQQRSLEPIGASVFPVTDETTGNATLEVPLGWRLDGRLYGRREVAYAAAEAQRVYLDERFGASLSLLLAGESRLEVFVEEGENRFRSAAPGATTGTQDVEAWGARLPLSLGRRLTVSLAGGETRFRGDEGDRRIRQLGVAVTLGFGDAAGEW